jgi:hypothetical protein
LSFDAEKRPFTQKEEEPGSKDDINKDDIKIESIIKKTEKQ